MKTSNIIFVTIFQVNFTIYILLWDFGLYFGYDDYNFIASNFETRSGIVRQGK